MITLYDDLSENNELEEPGQFDLFKVIITTKVGHVDIKSMVESFNLYESIFKTFVTGDITLLDRVGFANTSNITGTEPVYIEFGTKGSTFRIKSSFIVTKIKNKEKINENTSRYTLSLVAPEMLTDARTKISRSFDGKYSDMVKDIYTDYLSSGNPLWLEETHNNNRTIIPNKSPVDAINMIAQFSLAKTAANANFLFFQTTKSFHFRSISEMIRNDSIKPEGLTFRVEKERPSLDVPISEKFTRAIEFEIKSNGDILRHTAIGTYGSSLIKHNLRSKNWRKVPFSFHEVFKFGTNTKFIKINDYPASPDGPVTEDKKNLSDFPESYVNMVSGSEEHQYQTYYDTAQFDKLDYENTILQRKSEMNSMNLQRAKLTIPGMSGLQAGDVISMFVPKPKASSGLSGESIEEDKTVSGKWLIESIAHQVSEKYYCELMIIRDSVPNSQKEYKEFNYPDSTPKIIDVSPMGSSNK